MALRAHTSGARRSRTRKPEDGPGQVNRRTADLVESVGDPVEVFDKAWQERFRRLVEVTASRVWVMNAQGGPETIWGTSDGKFLERSSPWDWLSAVHPDERQRAEDCWRGAVKTGRPYESEFQQLQPNGEYRLVRVQAAPILDTDGQVREWVGITTDITDRKRTEQELAEAIQRLNAHMDNSPLAVIEFDAQLLVTRWSKEAEKVFGWTAAEILGRRMFEIPWVYQDDLETVRAVAQGMLDRTRPRNLSRNRNYRKGGSTIECEWYNSAIYDEHGNLTSILSQVLDITERKRAEERLREAQKMESIAMLAGGVAHDFNNLLVGVVGNAGIASELVPAGSPVKELLRRIIKSGEQAAHLTRQMLAYSGKGQFIVEPIDLTDVVREVTDLVRSTAPKKIAIQIDLEPELPSVEADRSQIHQVLMNLVINATEAIGDQPGLIAVQTGIRQVDSSYMADPEGEDIPPGRYVFLEVRDTGCGMDQATKSRIFDPFFTTKFTGRGLGLAAVTGIVRAHGGAIHVRTAPGRGTSFVVLFPALESQSQSALRVEYVARETELCLQTDGKILVVDDEEMVRNLVKVALERSGCAVLIAGSGSEAEVLLKQNAATVSLVILDLSMPVMNGQEVLPKLLAINPSLKVMLSSGYAEADAMKRFNGMPVSAFIQKPYSVQRLIESVKTALGRQSY